MMWYFFLVCTTVLMLISYRLCRLRRWRVFTERITYFKSFASPNTIVILASLSLLSIIFLLREGSPGKLNFKQNHINGEVAAHRALGRFMGQQFATLTKSGAKVLILNRIYGNTGRACHYAFKEGFHDGGTGKFSGISEELLSVPAPKSAADAADAANRLILSAEQFDELVEKHPGITIIVSLIGVPSSYSNSSTRLKVASGEMLFGVFTDTVYSIGDLIFDREITACVVPASLYKYENSFLNVKKYDESQVRERFIYINNENIVKVLRRNRQLFKSSHKT